LDARRKLVDCVRSLYAMGLTSPVSGNHSIRAGAWMWITPSELPRYLLRPADLVKVDLKNGRATGRRKPSIEVNMHRMIYGVRSDVGAVVHTHNPYTTGIAISAEFRHVIEEARIVVGGPAVIANRPSGSIELAEAVAAEFKKGARAVVVKNHGVVAAGKDIHHARAMVESLEEWAKVLTVARVFGGPVDYL
jgi:ribulose-5-phosphate 4-epimerase/fuculose-1-phosphate aldolase